MNIANYLRAAFYRTPVRYTFPKFYVIIDITYIRLIFYNCKIRLRNRKNFAKDRSKFLVKRWFSLN